MSDSRNKEIALVRIKRLASSGLRLRPFVETLFQLIHDGVPHNPNRVFLAGDLGACYDSGLSYRYLCTTPETEALTNLHRRFFGGPWEDDSNYRLNEGFSSFLNFTARTKTIWKGEELFTDRFYESDGFNLVYRPLGYHELAMVNFVEGEELLGSYPLWRGIDQRPFSRQDFAFFEAIAPQVSHGLKVAFARAASDDKEFLPSSLWGTGIVVMNLQGKVLAMDDRARDTFAHLGGLDGRQSGLFHRPPKQGLDYIHHMLARIFGSDAFAASAPATRVFTHWSGIQLRLRGVLAEGTDGRRYVTVMVERGEGIFQRRQRFAARWGLSPRENEVLELVAGGKTNRQIATILGLSPLTVKNHVERILLTLGVETRTAAAALILEDRPSRA